MRDNLWPAVLLAWIAGFVDALGYLALAHVFTAHMSGNAAAAGAHLGTARWSEVAIRGLPIPAFLMGVMIGAFAVDLTMRTESSMRLAPAFTIELALLVLFLVLCPSANTVPPSDRRFFALMSVLTCAMGVQSATLRRAGGHRIRTTFVTGMLTSLGEQVVALAIWGERRRRRQRHAMILGAIFVSFMAGAAAGGFAEMHWGPHALLIPIAGLAAITIDDVVTSGAHHGGGFKPKSGP